jgi:phosphatidate cytidylyltransferase
MNHAIKSFIKRVITGSILGTFFVLIYFKLAPIYFSIILTLILCQIVVVEWRNFFDFRSTAFWMLMPWYPIMPFLCMIMLNQSMVYRDLLFFLIAIVSSHDTGSYVFGSLLGKKRIAHTISPGKTWEGFFGGYIFACFSFGFILLRKQYHCSMLTFLSFTLFVCFLSLSGDLFESWLKRQANIKDSGYILPGHGGFLDRFDGIMFAAVFFFIFKIQILQLLRGN